MAQNALFKTPLFYQNKIISGFFYQMAYQEKVLQHIRAALPEALAKHVLYCLIKDKQLLVYTDAAVWAAQLRFYNKVLLAKAAPFITSVTLETVQVRIVSEPTGLVLRPVRKANIPSLQTIDRIQSSSQGITDDQLKLSLQKLSSTLKRKRTAIR